ncbi:ComEC/Rec2 family competence protein [Paenarthrobacter sp. NyZ202]|uniref:ComEC/Rec2 family competence protein n=1 Tax=Paenarthrobacter sp. NyZ202 TaxID=3402689 RepID=UPI003CF4C2E8
MQSADSPRRLDLRLLPAVTTTWLSVLVAIAVPAMQAFVMCTALLVLALVLWGTAGLRRRGGHRRRTMWATMALACAVSAAATGHAAADAVQRQDGPLAAAPQDGGAVVAEVEISGIPTALPFPGRGDGGLWRVPATMVRMTAKGQVVQGAAQLVVLGTGEWSSVRPGTRVRTIGRLKEPGPGSAGAMVLSASTKPQLVGQEWSLVNAAAQLRAQFRTSAAWLPPDAAGLLPGMVTGDTTSLPAPLELDMQTTGMTHLTAVSGANCSLVLGGFIVLARTLRLPRPPAAAFAAGGLAAFVVLVGTEPSVLRAAVMGCAGLVPLMGGHRGRSLSFLFAAIIVLLIAEPALAGSPGFLLSVLATLGIVLLATRIGSWLPGRLPAWLATGFAVPLSAQVLCGPVIVMLQPQLSPYALPANLLAGLFVAPITILGTIAVPLSAVHPGLAVVPLAVAGACAGVVAGIARFFAALPGAALPWAEGPVGVLAMCTLSVMTVMVVWAVLHPRGVRTGVLALHHRLVVALERAGGNRPSRRAAPANRRDARPGHGKLGICTKPSGRKYQWLPKTRGPGAQQRTRSPGGTHRRLR